MSVCKAPFCLNPVDNTEFCIKCEPKKNNTIPGISEYMEKPVNLAVKYPKYYKDVSHLTVVDVYRVLDLFSVTDHAIGHAAKKLLLCGNRTGNKDIIQDITEARDTLNRFLAMQEEDRIKYQ